MQKLLALFLTALFAAPLAAQTQTITYSLDNVRLKPDVSHGAGAGSYPMTGEFTWTYTPGDFENGLAEMQWVSIPWFGSDLSEMVITIETNQLEFSLLGNWHNRGLDVTLKLYDDFTETSGAFVNTTLSTFDIESGGVYQGHAISGLIKPEPTFIMNLSGSCPDALQADIHGASPNKQVALLYGFGMGSFIIPNGYPCAGTMLGLNNTVTLGTTLTANAAGDIAFPFTVPPGACGAVYLQALDLETCAVTSVSMIQ
jgi:hypothetical protein